MSPKLWVIITAASSASSRCAPHGQLLSIVQRTTLVDAAFVIIAWVGVKLLIEYAHQMHWIAFAMPKWLSLGIIVVLFGAGYVIALRHGPVEMSRDENDASDLLRQ
jgi:predicted tellurium resistance membrane protein TerC